MYGQSKWPDESGCIGKVHVEPVYLLLPLYHKIRIPFEHVLDRVVGFSEIMEQPPKAWYAQAGIPPSFKVEWDLRLTTNSQLKQSVRENDQLESGIKTRILIESGPRYLWRATAVSGVKTVLDLIFDATDIEVGKTIFRSIEYHPPYANLVRTIAPILPANIGPAREIIDWFTQQKLEPSQSSHGLV